MKTDITHYSSQELSLQFLNDEGLYRDFMRAVRRNSFSYLQDIADEYFIYDSDQLEDLRETFEDELDDSLCGESEEKQGESYYCSICEMDTYISDDTPYGTCQCS